MCIKITSKDCCLQKQAACWSQALIPACHWNGFDFITRSFSAMTVQPLVNCNSWWTGNCCAQQTLISTYATSASLRKSNTGSRSTVPFLLNINQFPREHFSMQQKSTWYFFYSQIYRESQVPLPWISWAVLANGTKHTEQLWSPPAVCFGAFSLYSKLFNELLIKEGDVHNRHCSVKTFLLKTTGWR